MKIAEFALKHKVATILACLMIVIFGVIAYFTLPLSLYPKIEVPVAVVQTTYTGAGPEEIEKMVTRPIESACASVSGMKKLQSTSSDGSSLVIMQFTDDTDLNTAMADVRDKIDRIRSTLPDDATTPMVMSIDVDALPVVTIGLSGADPAALQALADDSLVPYLERIDGVASVDVAGGYENEVAVNTYPTKMAGYGLTVSALKQALDAQNVSVSAGTVNSGGQSLNVRTDGEFSSVSDIANLLIPLPSGGSVRLSEIADVRLRPQEQTSIAKLNGKSCVVLSVNKQSGVNTVQVAQRTEEAMNSFTASHPTLKWTLLTDQSEFIHKAVNSVTENIILGILFSVIVLFVALRRLNSTFILAISMPICVALVFLVMQRLGLTMNMMSLGGIGLGVGMIVDNSIVVLENIIRYRNDGHTRWESCVEGTGEVAMAVTASTLTAVAVFLPMSMVSGTIGQFFHEFSLTIVILIASSLAVALTLVPLLCYALLDRTDDRRVQATADTTGILAHKPPMRAYLHALQFLITKRYVTVVLSIGLVVVFCLGVGANLSANGIIMMPETDESGVSVSIEMPAGSRLQQTEEIADRVAETALKQIPETESVSYTTKASLLSLSTGDATVNVKLKDKKDRHRSSKEIANDLRSRLSDIAGAKLTTQSTGASETSSSTGSALSLELSGDDYSALTTTANNLVKKISNLPDAVDIKSSAADRVPSVTVTLNEQNASQFGLNAASVGSMVRDQLTGETATELRMDGKETTVTVRGDQTSKTNLDALKSIPITTSTGGTVPLSMIADIKVSLSPQQIDRVNQTRTVTITGDSASGNSSKLTTNVKQILASTQLPDGVSAEFTGETQETADSLQSLGYALLASLGLVYFILAAQYESFLLPVIIMMILPASLLGALFGLTITGTQISMPACIGVIVLAGSVLNASIVLVDYTETRRKRGEDKNTAIMNACPRRVRPVIMTHATACLGLLPMALGIGNGSEAMQPMAIVMMFGMFLSVLITLFFTPVYYSLLDSMKVRVMRIFQRKARKRLPAERGK